jgi:putative hydrolase of the HAD superfamily
MTTTKITTLLLDIGGVLLTNGWGHGSRKLAAEQFGLDAGDMEERHHLTVDTYEQGKLSLDGYLDRVVFCRERAFRREEFKEFMFRQSTPFPGMIGLVRSLKARHGLKIVAVNNEGRELSDYRIRTFALDSLFDLFLSSCFVHYRKPDADIYRMALDISQATPETALYIDDRLLFVEVARTLGLQGIHHRGEEETRHALAGFGLAA